MPNPKDTQAGRLAREKKSQRRQGSVQQTAAEIQASAPGLSPQVAGSMGAPLDPSKGFSFEPDARPPDLPQPGDAPGGAEQFSDGPGIFGPGTTMGDMMAAHQGAAPGGLPDDHDALVGPGVGPGGPPPGTPPGMPPQSPQMPPPAPQTVPGTPKAEHPILEALRKDVGLDPLRPQDVTVGGHRWTLQTLSPGDLARASAMADMTSSTVTQREMVYHIAVAAQSTVAIDGVPVYQVFSVNPAPGVLITDHLRPPRPVRYTASAALFDFISDDTRTEMGEQLYEAYRDRCDRDGAVSSYLKDRETLKVRFQCQVEGCGHELFVVPQVDTNTGDIQLPFCQYHGTGMPIVSAEVEPGLPLA